MLRTLICQYLTRVKHEKRIPAGSLQHAYTADREFYFRSYGISPIILKIPLETGNSFVVTSLPEHFDCFYVIIFEKFYYD
jgi:hypothetical protein